MPERLRIETDIEQLPAAEWQRLTYGHPALRLELLKALAATARTVLPLRIFMLEDESGIAAAALCETVASNQTNSALDSLLFGRAAAAATRLGASSRPTLLFRTPVGTESAVVVRPADSAEQRRILSRLLDAIERHAAQQRLGIAVIGVLGDHNLLGDVLAARHYLATDIQPHARLPIQWADFDGYVEYLRGYSQNSARNARRERSRNQRSGVSIRHLPCTAASAGALYRLAREHYRHKNGVDPQFEPEFLPRLATLLGDEFLLFEALREGHRIGMLGAVRSGSVGWMAWYGTELTDRPNDFTYANLVFYHPADVATQLGLKTLLYGTHALDAKRRRGCQILRSRLFYRPHRPLTRFVAGAYFLLHRAWFRRKIR
ncbi:MAG TPA: GNAT family N-acetyltransferase [Steroidobacteraceae bacterium]